MAEFIVEVDITTRKELRVYAKDKTDADRKAVEIVWGWDGIRDVEVVSVEEE